MRPSKGVERSIGRVPRTLVESLLAVALTAFALLPASASVQAVAPEDTPAADPSATPADPARPASPPRGVKPRGPTVSRRLATLRDAGQLTPEAHDAARARYSAALAAHRRLTGRRRAELGGVLATLEAVTARNQLTGPRVALAFETLERNREWWTTGALLSYGARVGFAGSELVWQSYPGQGIQVQWLGTFGKANGLTGSTRYAARLRRLLDEAIALAAPRAGGIAFESWFSFDGGRPPWVSALGQGTGIQALARAGTKQGEARYVDAARDALGIFRQAPPEGVRLVTPLGAHYLQYSFAPGLRIVNGFVQALNGLHDFSALTGDPAGTELFASGAAQLRSELPRADTGAWSRYSVGGKESDLGYHRLLRDLLRGLCQRTSDPLYCDTATRFTEDLTRPPAVVLLPAAAAARKGRTARVAFTLDKVSSVAFVAKRAGAVIFTRTERLPRGRHAFTLPKLRTGGELELRLRAVDPAGNATAVAGVLAVAGSSSRR